MIERRKMHSAEFYKKAWPHERAQIDAAIAKADELIAANVNRNQDRRKIDVPAETERRLNDRRDK